MYQLHQNSVVEFERPQQVLITSENDKPQFIMLFLQADNRWYQIYLDEKILFINNMISDHIAIDEILADYDWDKKSSFNLSIFNQLFLQFEFNKNLKFKNGQWEMFFTINDDNFVLNY